MTVREVEERLATGEWDDRLDDVAAAEAANKDRKGVHDAIDER